MAPHPDDELLGAPAILMALRDGGARIVNVACGLGRRGDEPRRLAELTEACARAGFELVVLRDAPPIGSGDDLPAAQRELAALLVPLLARHRDAVVAGPSPHDGHPGHEVVGRAIRDAVQRRDEAATVLFWGLWSDLPLPNLLLEFGDERLAEIEHALAAHAGELARNPYDRLLRARAATHAVLGPERVFGFGAGGGAAPFGELATLVTYDPRTRTWRLAPPRRLDPTEGLHGEGGPDVTWWVTAPSARELLRRARG